MTEEWRPVPGYEGYYEVSNYGQVRRTGRAKGAKVGRTLKQYLNSTGYWRVKLYNGRFRDAYLVHRVVASAFLGAPEGVAQVDHIDGDRTNNRLDNLRWVTAAENQAYMALRVQLPKSRLTRGAIRAIRANPEGISQERLAVRFDTDQAMVSKIQRGVSWTAV